MSPGFVIDFPRTVRYILQKEIFNLTEKIANTLQNLRGLPTPSALTHTQPQHRKRRSRSPPHKIIQKEYKKIHFFFDRIFYYKGTSFMNETKRCISKSKNHIQTDKT